jgi:Xaa-Pro aminopeptidase
MTLRLDLPPMEVASRAERLRRSLRGARCQALVVTNLTNVRYLTGFTGSAGLAVVTKDGLLLVTDGRYAEQAPAQLRAAGVDAAVEITVDARPVVQAALGATARIGLEASHVSWATARRYADEWFADAEVVPTDGLVEALREVKDDGEVARIEAACAVADAALAAVRHRLADGPTEREFGLELDTEMRKLGASGVSFETIVASGPNGAMPHHRPGNRRIVEGDLVVLDFGALVDGYHSDMTRTLAVGEPGRTQQRMLDAVAESQAAGVQAVAAGVEASAVDDACRSVLKRHRLAKAFVHGTGHGVGLDIHEDPRVGRTSAATLAAGNVVTVEPGVYLPAHGGVRIEDTVVVTAGGCRALTQAPKTVAVA